MNERIRAVALIMIAGVVAGPWSVMAQQPARGGRGAGGRGGPPLVAVRPADGRLFRTAAAQVLGWRVGVPATAFGQVTFSEAAAKADALGLASLQGFSEQKVSPAIQKNLDYNLSAEEIGFVKNRLAELRLRMSAYRVSTLGADDSSRRKLFEFAKAVGVETILATVEPASLADVDRLAGEAGVNVALENRLEPKAMLSLLEGRSKRIGVSGDLGAWMQAGVKPLDGLAQFRDRLLVVNLRDRSALGAGGRDVALGAGVAGVAEFLRAANKMELKPLVLTIQPTGPSDDMKQSVEAAEKGFQLAMGDRLNVISKNTPITPYDKIPQEIRAAIDAATPRQAPVKPRKARKLLILDENLFAYVHATIPHGNLALELMGKYTGAYTPVFSNDLDNLKYPKIKEFDAIFLNSAGGFIFVEPEVRDGLTRFIREGGGLAAIHAASYASLEWREGTELIGAGDGPHRVEKVTLKVDDPHSPVAAPLDPKGFVYVDEFYHFPTTGPYSREKLHILLSIDGERTDLSPWPIRPDNDYGMAWVKSYGQGRVFYSELGHTPTLFMTPALSEFVLRGIQFALGDLDADTTPSAKLATKK